MGEAEAPLTAEQIAEIREELLRALARLERSLKTSRQAAKPVALDQTTVGRLSRIDALQNQGLTQELHGREQARHAQIEAALRRLDEGRYGLCEACGQPIPFARLVVFPETPTCGSCPAT